MVVLGLILLILGLFGVLRTVLVPLGTALLVIGVVVDVIYGVWHVGTALF